MRITKLFAAFTAFVLSLTCVGCSSDGNSNNSQPTYGCYVESDMANVLPEGEEPNGCFSDGVNNVYIYTFPDDTTINVYSSDGTKQESGWLNEALTGGKYDIENIFYGQDGELYGARSLYTEEDEDSFVQFSLIKASADRKSFEDVSPSTWGKKVTYPYFEGERYPTIENMNVCSDGTIVYTDGMESKIYLSDSGEKVPVSNYESSCYLCINNMTLYYIMPGQNKVFSYDCSTRKRICEYECDFNITQDLEFFLPGARITADDNAVYVITQAGIYRHLHEGTLWECIADGQNYRMGFSSSSFADFVMLADTSFYVSYIDITSFDRYLNKYTYDKAASTIEKTKLTIYSLEESAKIRDTIARYRVAHPEVSIEYIVADDNSSATISDRIRTLNTELLSGNGADILILDGLPAESYIEKGVLEDLSDIFNPMIENGELLPNISENYINDGKVYYMPVQFAVNFFFADSKTMALNPDPAVLAKNSIELNDDKTRLTSDVSRWSASSTEERLFRNFLNNYYDTLMNDDNTLNQEAFTKFITDIKTIANSVDEYGDYSPENQDTQRDIRNNTSYGNYSTVMSKQTHIVFEISYSVDDMLAAINFTDKYDIQYKSINNNFIPNVNIGVNSSSKNIDVSKELVRFIFSEEIQSINLKDGYPVNKPSFDAIFNSETGPYGDNMRSCMAFFDENGDTQILPLEWPDNNTRTQLKQKLLETNKPVFDNPIIEEILWSNAKDYFDGNIIPQKAADNAATSLDTYYSE